MSLYFYFFNLKICPCWLLVYLLYFYFSASAETKRKLEMSWQLVGIQLYIYIQKWDKSDVCMTPIIQPIKPAPPATLHRYWNSEISKSRHQLMATTKSPPYIMVCHDTEEKICHHSFFIMTLMAMQIGFGVKYDTNLTVLWDSLAHSIHRNYSRICLYF